MKRRKEKRVQKARSGGRLGVLCCRVCGTHPEDPVRGFAGESLIASSKERDGDSPANLSQRSILNAMDRRGASSSGEERSKLNRSDLMIQVESLSRLSICNEVSEDDIIELIRLHEKFPEPLLGPQRACDVGKKTLVLDLDETLVHSSFQPVPISAFIIPVELENVLYEIYVAKRPGVEEFINFCSDLYEVVIFTASLGKYADPLLDRIDPQKKCYWRLCRESCLLWQGNYIKDLSKLGRSLRNVLIVDNSPASSILQPDNAIPIRTWFDDPEDRELYELMPILQALARVDDIQYVIRRTAACESEDSEI